MSPVLRSLGLRADVHQATGVAVAALAVALLALLIAWVAFVRTRRLTKTFAALGGVEGEDALAILHRASRELALLRADVAAAHEEASTARAEIADSLRHVAVVRYDAFGDMGGRLSFSAALLDDGGDGLVLTSINGRSETRTYAKGVKDGQSEQSLSPEEEQSIGYARRGVSASGDKARG